MESRAPTEPRHSEQVSANDLEPSAFRKPQSSYDIPASLTKNRTANASTFSTHSTSSANILPQNRPLHSRPQEHGPYHDSHGNPLLLLHPPTGKETPDDSPAPSSGASADEDEMLTMYQFHKEGHRPLELRRQVLKWNSYNVSGDSEIFPKSIACELSVTFNSRPAPPAVVSLGHKAQNQSFPNPHPKFVWYEEHSYESIQQYCEEQKSSILKQLAGEHPHGEFHVYLRYGLCNVRGTNDETKFSPDTSKFDSDNMSEIAIKEVCRFIYTYPNQKFKLILACDYGSITTRLPDVKFVELMKKQYRDKLNISTKTVSGHSYISKPDIDQLTTPMITNQIINESDELGNEEEKASLKEIVSRVGAQTVLALCVHEGINLRIFKHFVVDHKYKDGNLPKEAPEQCNWEGYRYWCEHYHSLLIEGAHQFFVPIIEEDRWFHERGAKEVVPISFACDENGNKKERLGKGAYSKVWEVRIDITHQSLASNLSKTYALKIFEDDNTTDERGNLAFSKEIRNLLYLAQYPHHHILTHITSWEQNRKFYILYEKAKSNLRHYTKTEKGGILTKAQLLWFFSQLLGLANAVRKVHQLREPITGDISPLLTPRPSSPQQSDHYSGPEKGDIGDNKAKKKRRRTGIVGYHHDIKPDNILAFEQPGQLPILKLSDFGAGKFSAVRQQHESGRPTHNPNGTLTYFGPEYPAGAKMTRPFDMWALGCVFLELLLWLLDLHQPHNGPTLSTLRQKPFEGRDEVFDYFWQRKSTEEVKFRSKSKTAAPNIQKHAAGLSGTHLNVPNRDDLIVEGFKLNEGVDNVLRDLKQIYCVDMVAFQNLIQQIRGLLEIRPTKRLNAVNLANRLDAILSQLEVDLKDYEMHDEDNIYADWFRYNRRNAEARRNHQPLEPRDNISGQPKQLAPQLARPQNPTDDVSNGYSRRYSISDINMSNISHNDDSQDGLVKYADQWAPMQSQSRLSPSSMSQSHFFPSTDEEDMAEDNGTPSRRRQRSLSVETKAPFRTAKKSRRSQASTPGHVDDEM